MHKTYCYNNLSKEALKHSGYDLTLVKSMSFHSIRSRMLCSAYLNGGRSDGDILNDVALIAGWLPHSRAQLRNIKETMIA